MKKVLKVLAMLFMLFSTFGSALNAFAVPADRPASGNLHIYKYLGDKTGQSNDGTEVTIPADRELLDGVKFDVYKIVDPDDGTTPYPPPGNLGAADIDKWSYTRTKGAAPNPDTLTVTGNGANDGKSYTYTLNTAISKTTVAGVAEFDGLSGYYYVEEDVAGSMPVNQAGESVVIANGMDPFIVAVPMWNQTGDKWLEDVYVYPKNQDLSPEKKPEKPSVAIGEELNWFVTADIPDNFVSTNYEKFDIWDQFDYRLDYQPEPIVEGGYTDGDEWVQVVELTADLPTPDYTVEVVAATPTGNPPTGAKVTVKLTADGINKLGSATDVEQIRVTFKTKSNQYVEGTELTNNDIPNEATVEFTNKNGESSDTTPETKVLQGSIAVDKIDDKGDKLKGAEFQLADSEINANAGNYLKVVLNTDNNGIVSILKPGDTGYDGAIPWVIRPNAETSELGLKGTAPNQIYYSAAFRGLKIGEYDSNTPPGVNYYSYWLVETKAPAEFNMLDEPFKVTFSATTENQLITKEVVNKRGFTLPETGSLVTILLTVLGIIFIGFSIIMSINKRKKA